MLTKDIIFSNELQDSLSMAVQIKRIGESKVITARAEVESACLIQSRRYTEHCTCYTDSLLGGYVDSGENSEF
jgi:hypothetical protein